MTSKGNQKNLSKRYRSALEIFDKNLKYLESIEMDKDILFDCRKILNHIRSRSLAEIAQILFIEERAPHLEKDIDALEVGRMTLDEIRTRITSPQTTRATMEKIATVRFGVTKGGLSALRNRDALRDKIESLLTNEGAHDLISQVVQESDATRIKK